MSLRPFAKTYENHCVFNMFSQNGLNIIAFSLLFIIGVRSAWQAAGATAQSTIASTIGLTPTQDGPTIHHGRICSRAGAQQCGLLPQSRVKVVMARPRTSSCRGLGAVSIGAALRDAFGELAFRLHETPIFREVKSAWYLWHFRSQGLSSTAPAHQI